jgi:hypothetical protein
MRSTLPVLAISTAILVACASDGPDELAEMLRDAGAAVDTMLHDAAALIDASGPEDARAQPLPKAAEVMDSPCDKTWTPSGAGQPRRYHQFQVEPARIRSAWTCDPTSPQPMCPAATCTGENLTVKCYPASPVEVNEGGVFVECGIGFQRVRLVLEPG